MRSKRHMHHINRLGPVPYQPHALLKLLRLPVRHMRLDARPPDRAHKRPPPPALDILVLDLLLHPARRHVPDAVRVRPQHVEEPLRVLLEAGFVDGGGEVEGDELGDGGGGRGVGEGVGEVDVVVARGVEQDGGEVLGEGLVGAAASEGCVFVDAVPVCGSSVVKLSNGESVRWAREIGMG